LLIHGCATIDCVWRIIESSLPGLYATVSALLVDLGAADA